MPQLNAYSLQFTALLILTYMFLKWRTKNVRAVLPKAENIEFSILLTSLLLLVGSTGSVSSLFLPVLYLLLFFAVLILETSSVVLLDALLVLFLWATTPQPLTQHHMATLISFIVLLPLLIFAKTQYDEMKKTQQYASVEEEEIMLFLSTFLKPKMKYLHELSEYVQHNEQLISKQIRLIQDEIDGFIEKAKTLMERK